MKYKVGDVIVWTSSHWLFGEAPVEVVHAEGDSYRFIYKETKETCTNSKRLTEENTRKLTKLERALK